MHTTHKIDADINETREFPMQDLLLSGSMAGIGYVSCVGPRPGQTRATTTHLTLTYTDGLRLVLFLSKDYVSPNDVEFVPWTWPGPVETPRSAQ
jgi:hypothetical protein